MGFPTRLEWRSMTAKKRKREQLLLGHVQEDRERDDPWQKDGTTEAVVAVANNGNVTVSPAEGWKNRKNCYCEACKGATQRFLMRTSASDQKWSGSEGKPSQSRRASRNHSFDGPFENGGKPSQRNQGSRSRS